MFLWEKSPTESFGDHPSVSVLLEINNNLCREGISGSVIQRDNSGDPAEHLDCTLRVIVHSNRNVPPNRT